MTTTSPAPLFVPDAHEREFARLADVALAAGEDELRRERDASAPPALAAAVERLMDGIARLKVRAETGQLRRPSQGIGFALARDVGELSVGEAFDGAVRALERYYQDRM